MAKPSDSTPDIVNGTQVREVDAQGNLVEKGFLQGKVFKTVSWSTREADPEIKSPCPIWIKNVVISETLDGANKGAAANLAGPNDADVSSSSSSQNVNAIVVDAEGKEVTSKVFKFSLVRAIQGEPPPGQMAIATDLWFSMQPIDTSKPEIAKMANRCQLEAGGGGPY